MAWSHSYTPEAYDIAREELEKWASWQLAQALAEYNYGKFHGDTFRKGHPHHKGKWEAKNLVHLSQDILVQACMDAIRDVGLCDNGAWAMWIDWEGWHTVNLPEEKTDRELW